MQEMTADALFSDVGLLYQPQIWAIFIAGAGVGVFSLLFCSRLAQRPVKRPDAGPEPNVPGHDLFKEGSPQEQRCAARRKGRNIGVDFASRDENEGNWTGYVLDRSLVGLRLASERKVEIGTIVKVRVSEHAQFMPWLDIEVKRCGQMPSGWELGCQFVHPPTYNLLLAFG